MTIPEDRSANRKYLWTTVPEGVYIIKVYGEKQLNTIFHPAAVNAF